MQPKIGIISSAGSVEPKIYGVNSAYVRAVAENGGIPVVIPVTEHTRWSSDYAALFDGLLLPGGEDVHPFSYGQEPVPQVTYMSMEKDEFELALIQEVIARDKPIFGICRGHQLLNVALGGSLYQDIPSQLPGSICHLQSSDIRSEPVHLVKLSEGSAVARSLCKTEVRVNSYHHQAVKEVPAALCAVGFSTDGIIEATESPDGRIFSVQWHPECLFTRFPEFAGLFRRLTELSSR